VEEQNTALRDSLAARLSRSASEDTWAELAKAGVLGICVPEKLGGLGLGIRESEPVFEVLGELCRPTRFLESSIIVAGLLDCVGGEESRELLRRLTDPDFVIAIVGLESATAAHLRLERYAQRCGLSGRAALVLEGDEADVLLVLVRQDARVSLAAVLDKADGLVEHAYPTIDGRMAADLRFNDATCVVLADDCSEALSRVIDQAIACTAIEAAALMTRLVDDTASFARDRAQFGQPIGSFQVVQHRLVDMYIAARRAGAIARRAMAGLEHCKVQRAALASAAKVTIAETGRYVGQQAVQLHGAIGTTYEHPVSRYFKRLTAVEQQLGDSDMHVKRYVANAFV